MMLSPAFRTSQRPLRRVVDYLDHAVRQTEIAHHLDQLPQPRKQQLFLIAGELDQQDRSRPADQRSLHGWPQGRIGQREVDHGAVDQFHRRGP
jgi:hypothetical protein